jgi:nucleoid DNA-binding protein
MTYNQLISKVSVARDISKSRAKELIDELFLTLEKELEEGKGVSIPGLGTFRTKIREERRVFSPHHETYIMVPPKRVVDFTPSSGLKDNLKFAESDDE